MPGSLIELHRSFYLHSPILHSSSCCGILHRTLCLLVTVNIITSQHELFLLAPSSCCWLTLYAQTLTHTTPHHTSQPSHQPTCLPASQHVAACRGYVLQATLVTLPRLSHQTLDEVQGHEALRRSSAHQHRSQSLPRVPPAKLPGRLLVQTFARLPQISQEHVPREVQVCAYCGPGVVRASCALAEDSRGGVV